MQKSTDLLEGSSHKRMKKSKKSNKKSKRKRKRHTSTSSGDSSSSSDYSSSSDSIVEKHKIKKLKKKILKKKLKKLKKESKKNKNDSISEEEEVIGPAIPNNLVDLSKKMAPETKEEWEKRRNVIKRVYDEQTGRYRLIKGDGEVLEEIVSKERHQEINRQATIGDGEYFQSKLPHPKFN